MRNRYRYVCLSCDIEQSWYARQAVKQYSPRDGFVLCPECGEGEMLRLELLLLESALLLGVIGRILTAEEEEELIRLHHAGGDVGRWIESRREVAKP